MVGIAIFNRFVRTTIFVRKRKLDFLFLPVPKKKMGFLFQTKCRKNFTHFWMFPNKLSSLYSLCELFAENRIENESVEKESIRVRHLGFQCEKQQTSLHLLHMCV